MFILLTQSNFAQIQSNKIQNYITMATETQDVVTETEEKLPTEKEVMSEMIKSRYGKKEETKEEKPPVEEKTKEKAKPEIKTEPNAETKPEKKPEVKPEAPVQKSIDEMISEKTGGKYKTFEDFDKYANRQERKLSERIVKLAELEERGVDIYDIIKYESKGYDKLNPEKPEDAKKLLFEKWSEDEKGITQKELEFKYKQLYGKINKAEEDLSDDEKEEKEVQEIALMRKAKEAQQSLLDKRKDYELPKNNINQR